MDKIFDIIRQTRANFIALVQGLSLEQLNKIPAGFNNNIAWNFGHVIVTQQIICYKVSGYEVKIDEAIIEKYRKGTKPEKETDAAEWQQLLNYAQATLDSLKADYENGFFTHFAAYTTSYGAYLSSIEDALAFIPVHEALHYGYAMAQKKLV
jgi:uncharacterized damage-inducible protein DinB